MHWNNGRFHESITVGQKIYITDHKHVAIFGSKDYIGFGETGINSYIYGKDIGVNASNNANIIANNNIIINANKRIDIIAATDASTTANKINTTSTTDTAISAGTYINLSAGTGITVNNTSYGTTLPTTGNTEGRVFFKLIS